MIEPPTTQQKLPILTVSQLTNAIKYCLESNFPHIWLQGELSNFKLQTSGHLYFSLKDPVAQISAVMFRNEAATLKIRPKDGDQVLVRGEINVYPPTGKYQIIVREMRQLGLGELLLKFEELKQKLDKKGYFKLERKRSLPKFPKRIGVVTSPTGAVIQDILNVLTRRFSGFHLILNPVKVQGEGASQEIAQAIHQFNNYNLVDVMIVGRGGGSIEDLWAFNEEVVAEAIYTSKIPIISAVGHETDITISDFVADVRAPTPSAAAEMVIAEKGQQLHQLNLTRQRLQQTVGHIIRHNRQKLTGLTKQPVFSSAYGIIGPWMQRADDYRQDIDQLLLQNMSRQRMKLTSLQKQLDALRPISKILQYRQKLVYWDKSIRTSFGAKLGAFSLSIKQKDDALLSAWRSNLDKQRRTFNPLQKGKKLEQAWERILMLRKERLSKLISSLHSIDPKNLLKKGYSILFNEKDHSVITSVQTVEKNQDLRVLLADGEILTTAKEIIQK